MSNMLAQTTLPATFPVTQDSSDAAQLIGLLLLVVAVFGAGISGSLIARRKLYRIEPVPAGPLSAVVLAGALVVAAGTYLTASSYLANVLGLNPEVIKAPEGMRKLLMVQPAIQMVTLGVVLAMLAGVGAMPQALQWRNPGGVTKQAAGAYLLAIPWVLLTAIAIGAIAHRWNLSEEQKQHVIFRTWSIEPAGLTPFKAMAVFSAVIGAPLLEEVFFRGLAQRLAHLLTGRPVVAIVLASLAFTATHSPWPTWPPVFVLSLFLGWLYFRSGSILVPILMHAIFNAIQFALYVSGGAT